MKETYPHIQFIYDFKKDMHTAYHIIEHELVGNGDSDGNGNGDACRRKK